LQVIIEIFWNRWNHEYLTELREHQNCRHRIPRLQVEDGDVVLIHDENPRAKWKMGIVNEKYTGKDGFIRGCKVKTLTKNGKSIYLNRPVNKLYPLEIQSKT